MRRIADQATQRARALRREATPAERLLWCILAPYRPRFTRQLPAGRFIIDIACREARLAVELDGGQHAVTAAYDATRTALLEQQGWTILRLWNNEVLADPAIAAEVVLAEVARKTGVKPFRHERRKPDKE